MASNDTQFIYKYMNLYIYIYIYIYKLNNKYYEKINFL